jgi:hypothetical protein
MKTTQVYEFQPSFRKRPAYFNKSLQHNSFRDFPPRKEPLSQHALSNNRIKNFACFDGLPIRLATCSRLPRAPHAKPRANISLIPRPEFGTTGNDMFFGRLI